MWTPMLLKTLVGGGSLLGYHWLTERGKAGPVLSIKWVPLYVVKNKYEAPLTDYRFLV